MELKLELLSLAIILFKLLLIVPYGIETFKISLKYCITNLLIVPYGIET